MKYIHYKLKAAFQNKGHFLKETASILMTLCIYTVYTIVCSDLNILYILYLYVRLYNIYIEIHMLQLFMF